MLAPEGRLHLDETLSFRLWRRLHDGHDDEAYGP
jgi:hypothetical protein